MKQKNCLVMIAFGLLCLLCLTQCKREAPASIKLSEPVVSLSPTVKSAKVTVTSNVEWVCVGGEVALGPPVVDIEWIRVDPFISEAGTTEITVTLLEDKLPTKEASLTIQLQALKSPTSATLTVKYLP